MKKYNNIFNRRISADTAINLKSQQLNEALEENIRQLNRMQNIKLEKLKYIKNKNNKATFLAAKQYNNLQGEKIIDHNMR